MKSTFLVYEANNIGASHTTKALKNIHEDDNTTGDTSLQVNIVGAATLDLELQISIDGVNWATATTAAGDAVALVGVADTDGPFIFNYDLGVMRYLRFLLTNVTGTPDLEVWKT